MTQIISTNNWWGWGWSSYTAWTWIEISAQNEISVDADIISWAAAWATAIQPWDLSGYQTVANMVTSLTCADDDHYPTAKAVADAISWGWNWDVTWPNSSTDWDIVLFDWCTWKIIKDSWVWLSSKLDASALSDTNYWWAWNGDTTHTPTKNALYTKLHTMDVEIWNKAADNTVVKLSWNQVIDWTKQFCISPLVPSKTSVACNCCRDIATEAQVYNVQQNVDAIDELIPSAATCSNQLADKNYVNDSINSVTAYYITKNAQGDQFATYAELSAATTFYSWGVARTPTRNDYTIVLADENHDNATTRYIYNSGWEYQYTVNETALSQAQLDALNSWITCAKVSAYDCYATTKQDTLCIQTAYTSKGTCSKVAQISTNCLGQVTCIEEVNISYPSQVSDTAYWVSWDWETSTAPSQNAVYDKMESIKEVPSTWNVWDVLTKTNDWYEFAAPQAWSEIDAMTQADYNDLPNTKLTDWVWRLIYE